MSQNVPFVSSRDILAIFTFAMGIIAEVVLLSFNGFAIYKQITEEIPKRKRNIFCGKWLC